MKDVEMIEVIKTTLSKRGNGKDTPIRVITQYWDKGGNLLAEIDPCHKGNQELTPAEIMALKQARDLLVGFCCDSTYKSNQGDVNIGELFSKLI